MLYRSPAKELMSLEPSISIFMTLKVGKNRRYSTPKLNSGKKNGKEQFGMVPDLKHLTLVASGVSNLQ